MGTDNVIYLADFNVPSYRRGRKAASGAAAAAPAWHAMARERAAARRSLRPAEAQHELALVPAAPAVAGMASRPVDPAALREATGSGAVLAVQHAENAAPLVGAGRLRLSGRLIDVCAELERLAAAEACAARPRRA